MKKNKRRHKTGFGYSSPDYNQESRSVFSEIKYKLNSASFKSNSVDFISEKISAAERTEIKNKIRKSNKTKTVKILTITVISIIVLIIIAVKMIEGVLFRH